MTQGDNVLAPNILRLGAVALPIFLGPVAWAEPVKTRPAVSQVARQEPWQVRKARFVRAERRYGVADPSSAVRNQLSAEFISLLKTEGAYVLAGRSLPEEYTEYYADLIGTVATLPEDAALDALLIPSVLDTGAMATRGVAAFGQRAFPRLMGELAKRPNDSHVAFSMSLVFRDMLSGKVRQGNELDEASRARIREIAFENLDSEDVQLRALSITLIGRYDDPEATQRVLTLANAGSETPAVVRDAARSVLEMRAPPSRHP